MTLESLREFTIDLLGVIDYDLQKEIINFLEEEGENEYLEEIEAWLQFQLEKLGVLIES